MDWGTVIAIAIGTIIGRFIYDLLFKKKTDKE